MGASLFSGLIAGLFAAAAWVVATLFIDADIGWLVLAIGVFVGIGARAGTPERRNPSLAAAVALIALACVLAGRTGAVAVASGLNSTPTDEFCVSILADDIAAHDEAMGIEHEWPVPSNGEFPEFRRDYPPEIWRAAMIHWDAMSVTSRDKLRSGASTVSVPNAASLVNTTFDSFTLFDALWFSLALGFALRLATLKGRMHLAEGIEPSLASKANPLGCIPDAPAS